MAHQSVRSFILDHPPGTQAGEYLVPDALPCKFEARALTPKREWNSHVAVWVFEAYLTDLIHEEVRAGCSVDANYKYLPVELIAASIGNESSLRRLRRNSRAIVADDDHHPLGFIEN